MRNRRASILGLGLAALVVLPAPWSALDQPERQHVAACYSGILAGEPLAAQPGVVDLSAAPSGTLELGAAPSDALEFTASAGLE